MSQIGYYRYKTTLADGDVIQFFQNALPAGQATLKAITASNCCDGKRLIKFLDRYGRYRFFAFNDKYAIADNPSLIGKTNEFITSILNDQTNRKNVGYRNERILQLTADASQEELDILADIWTSPRVYLHVGALPSDIKSDWVEVTIDGDNTVRRRKNNSGPINISVTLPEWFTVKSV